MKKNKVSESKAQNHKQQKVKPKQKIMPKRKRWNYEDIEKYRKYFEGQKDSTQKKNSRRLLHYCEWAKVTPEALIKLYKETEDKKKWQRDRLIEIQGFYNYLKKEEYSINSARNIPSGILKFYTRYCETVNDATKTFEVVQFSTTQYELKQEVLRKVYYYADLEGQTLLSLAVSLGYASVDFLSLESEILKNLVNEATKENSEFIQFIGKCRQKTGVQPISHLTPEAIHNLKEYLEVLEKKHGFLPEFLFYYTNQGLNKKIRTMFEKANVDLYGKKMTFHLFRKFLYTIIQAKNNDIAKVITAKSVNSSDITYIQNLKNECFRVFKESYKFFALNGSLTGKKNKEQSKINKQLQDALTQVETENYTFKTRIDQLQKDNEKQKEINNEQAEKFNEINKNLERKFKVMKAKQNSHINMMLNVVIDNLDLSEEKQREIRKRFLIRRKSKNGKKMTLEEHINKALKDIKTGSSSLKNIKDVKNYFFKNGLCTKNEFDETWNKMCKTST